MSIEREPYQLVIRHEITAADEVEARSKAKKFIERHILSDGDCELKLQKIEIGKPPVGIRMPFLKNE